jgi:hypothetical protein
MRLQALFAVAALVAVVSCTKKPPSPDVRGGANPSDPGAASVAVAGPSEPVAARAPAQGAPAANAAPAAPGPSGAAPVLAPEARIIGDGVALGNLVVYPVTSHAQIDVGPLVTLDDALASNTAEVRELEGGGSVNTLVIENKGTIPIYVLAGTVVKGGNQDRQIGQDFIISAKETTPVDAFCVEHGRWSAERNGQVTGGRFRTSAVVATSKIRAAAQYKRSQGEVWSKVGDSTGSLGTRTASGTFVAAVDDQAIAEQRTRLAQRIQATLDAVSPQDDVVGIGYAIDGEVTGVRWFAHHKIFVMHENKLVNGIALEAITAQAEARAAGRPPSAKPAPTPGSVDSFVKRVEAVTATSERDTPAANVNFYKESSDAYGSGTMLKPPSPGARPTPVSKDFTKK